MTGFRLFVITGATSGLGFELVRRLLNDRSNRLVVGARDPARAQALRALASSDVLALLPLDLADLSSVQAFARKVIDRHTNQHGINGIACNAGVQLIGDRQVTDDGIERTFASNHLGHFVLVHAFLPHLVPGAAVISTASGTHDPADRLARLFGFRGAIFPSAEAVARGELDAKASAKQQGIDRYATSKLCNILFTYEMARRVETGRARFVAFDPGLMPGTGLARDRSTFERFGWANILPASRYVVPGVSTPVRSARALAELLIGARHGDRIGLHVDFTLAERPTSVASLSLDHARDLYDVSIRISGLTPLPARAIPKPR